MTLYPTRSRSAGRSGREASTVHSSTVEAFFVFAADPREDRNGEGRRIDGDLWAGFRSGGCGWGRSPRGPALALRRCPSRDPSHASGEEIDELVLSQSVGVGAGVGEPWARALRRGEEARAGPVRRASRGRASCSRARSSPRSRSRPAPTRSGSPRGPTATSGTRNSSATRSRRSIRRRAPGHRVRRPSDRQLLSQRDHAGARRQPLVHRIRQ